MGEQRVHLLKACMGEGRFDQVWNKHKVEMVHIHSWRTECNNSDVDKTLLPTSMDEARRRASAMAMDVKLIANAIKRRQPVQNSLSEVAQQRQMWKGKARRIGVRWKLVKLLSRKLVLKRQQPCTEASARAFRSLAAQRELMVG